MLGAGSAAGPARCEAPGGVGAFPWGGSVLQEPRSAPRFLGSVQSSVGSHNALSSRWGKALVLGTEGFQQGTKALLCPRAPGQNLACKEKKKKQPNQNRAKGTKGNLSQISFLAHLSCVGSGAEPLVPRSPSLASFPGRFCAIAMCWRVLLLQPIPSTPRQLCNYRWI